ncbi:SigE family RNA polymerase sigma factor [Streptomyces sp. SID3343]|uniref:SigE family RNA polymerase sigma factor n=1 Tax=Streptomyces sp. SID3343 TaxID=2690260 RepID=UPI00136EE688|nr:SigE family RNA polymerase sigma factor [Streptomyces sp. SID3343]MYW00436.1 SigE family RNA polymerase sigma factor [Streptomyces sp. SID3343]
MPGDEADFIEFAVSRQQSLYGLAFLLSGSREGAQDLTQTALARLFRYWRRASRAEDLDAYARTVLLRVFFAEKKRARRERAAHMLLDPPPPPDLPDLRLTVAAALDRLPPRTRAVVVLRYWADLSVEDTAAALGCSTGTVKTLSSRSRDRLRELLPDDLWKEHRHAG